MDRFGPPRSLSRTASFVGLGLCPGKQGGNDFHGKEEPDGTIRERNEFKVPVKSRGLFIDGVDDDGDGSDLRRLELGAAQRCAG